MWARGEFKDSLTQWLEFNYESVAPIYGLRPYIIVTGSTILEALRASKIYKKLLLAMYVMDTFFYFFEQLDKLLFLPAAEISGLHEGEVSYRSIVALLKVLRS